MNVSSILRSSFLLAALGSALCAHATSYVYAFVGGDEAIANLASLSYTSTGLISAGISVAPGQLGAASLTAPYWGGEAVTGVDFLPSSTVGSPTPMDTVVLHTAGAGDVGSNYWYFAPGTFGKAGQYSGSVRTATLSITPVPEPSAFAALGLGALAVLRRRKG